MHVIILELWLTSFMALYAIPVKWIISPGKVSYIKSVVSFFHYWNSTSGLKENNKFHNLKKLQSC